MPYKMKRVKKRHLLFIRNKSAVNCFYVVWRGINSKTLNGLVKGFVRAAQFVLTYRWRIEQKSRKSKERKQMRNGDK